MPQEIDTGFARCITSGNAAVDGQAFHQWFIGPLREWDQAGEKNLHPDSFGLRDTNDVEIKWGLHPRVQERPGGWSRVSKKTSISLLLRGDFVIKFRHPQDSSQSIELRLAREGDYVIWREDLEHTWIALEDSLIVTVRWKGD